MRSEMSRTRLALLSLATIVFISFVGAGIATWRAGMLDVRIHENAPGGIRLAFHLPAIVVPAVLRFVPDRVFAHAVEKDASWMPMACAAISRLAKTPDCLLVQVESMDERVRIAKEGRKLSVDVASKNEEVHLSVPLGMVSAVLERVHEASSES
jgi:hypothetical protein